MKYKDEIKIGIMTACFCCAMVMVYAVVPKDASVLRARATSTFKEAPETAAEAEAEKQSEAEDAGLRYYSEDSNYDYDTSDDSGSSDTSSSDADTTQNDDGSSMFPMMITLLRMITSTKTITAMITILPIRSLIRPMTDPSLFSYDDSSSDDVQTDYDTGGSDSSDDSSGSFEENLVQEETYY